ncbi:hypothetical protein L841_0400 [Mycobacterium sp. MAC_080597_8934]|nr:hypothetical protein L841_0400 [Mycobacterium sp. MAC_080597_8934]
MREREPIPPLKFAQLVGLIFAVLGAAGFAAGASLFGLAATAAAWPPRSSTPPSASAWAASSTRWWPASGARRAPPDPP